jgi:hypothetical protein
MLLQFPAMNVQQILQQAEKDAEDANRLLRAQEVEVARMSLAGRSVMDAQTLLSAFREAARLAEERKQVLQAEIARAMGEWR